jgi:predicted AAA+ superfamily ATPase
MSNGVWVYANQRMMYYQIKEFLEHGHPSCRIGVLTGIRRIGKTGILTDLTESLPNSTYVSMAPQADQRVERKKLAEALKKGEGYLFIDEVTHYKGYESLLESILFGVYNKYPHLKVIFSGSSNLHLLWMHYGPLGGGRSKLFRLSFLTFAEYLNFTGKVSGYVFKPCTTITEQDFKDYLQLGGLERTGLGLIFDETYMKAIFQNIEQSNRCARRPGNIADFTQHDLMCMLDVVGYTFKNHMRWDILINPDMEQESGIAGNIEDRQNMRIMLSAEQVEKMEARSVAKALFFFIGFKFSLR